MLVNYLTQLLRVSQHCVTSKTVIVFVFPSFSIDDFFLNKQKYKIIYIYIYKMMHPSPSSNDQFTLFYVK